MIVYNTNMLNHPYTTQARADYLAEVARGKHDDDCEVDLRGFFLCHCTMRARIAKVGTEPPGELQWHMPSCPRCWSEVDGDADGFSCPECHVTWGHKSDDKGTFNDDYGDIAGDKAKWLEYRAEKEAEAKAQQEQAQEVPDAGV